MTDFSGKATKVEDLSGFIFDIKDLPVWRGSFPGSIFNEKVLGEFPVDAAAAEKRAVEAVCAPPPAPVARDVRAPAHTAEIFDPTTFATVVDWIVEQVKIGGYEALAGSGHSGLIPAAAACYKLGIPLLAVRKDDERPKGDSSRVNGILPHRPLRYALVDDFVASGETVNRVWQSVGQAFPNATLTGLILFRVRADTLNELGEVSYSYIEANRDSVRRYTKSDEFAKSLRIHGRDNLRD